MAGFNHFDYVPTTVDRKRSVFKYDKAVGRSAYVGFLYPFCKPERMMPGSTLSINIVGDIKTVVPLVNPLFDELYCDCFSFWVSNRIVWEHWKQFIGAVDDVLFNNLTQYTIPAFNFGKHPPISASSLSANDFLAGQENFQWNQTIACHYGIEYYDPAADVEGGTRKYYKINALPFRGYTFIWNEYFRPEQLVQPIVFSKSDLGCTGQNIEAEIGNIPLATVWAGVNVYIPEPSVNFHELVGATVTGEEPCLGGAILPTYRVHRSLWTSCLPQPSLETMNLLANVTPAPVGMLSTASHIFSNNNLQIPSGNSVSGDFSQAVVASVNTSDKGVVADLSQALLTVNNYRETIMLQNYYDVLNRAGSRYDSIIGNIFGVTTDASLIDIPQLITHKRFTIYRNQVVSMSGATNNNLQDGSLGQQGAYIDTIINDSFFTFTAKEHGYLHMLYTIRPARIRVCQGIEPEWLELDKFSQYYPQFDGMGDVPRYQCEVFAFYLYPSITAILGYQEYGAVWKTQRNDVAGWLDPLTPNGLQGYTMTQVLNTSPILINTNANLLGYVSCLPESIAFSTCLAYTSPTNCPHFILDVHLVGSIAHPMPVYNIPGQGALL